MWSADAMRPKVPFWLPLTVRQHRLPVHRGFTGYFEDLRTTFVTLKSQRDNGASL
jgi:hypothetical protein